MRSTLLNYFMQTVLTIVNLIATVSEVYVSTMKTVLSKTFGALFQNQELSGE